MTTHGRAIPLVVCMVERSDETDGREAVVSGPLVRAWEGNTFSVSALLTLGLDASRGLAGPEYLFD